MMGDLRNPRVIVCKGFLFLASGMLSAGLLMAENPSFQKAFLLGVTIWSFCRFYYFAFYVIEKYLDHKFRFRGLFDCGFVFVRNAMKSRRNS